MYGGPLPSGYRRLLDAYGPGMFNQRLELFAPTPPDHPLSIARTTREYQEGMRAWLEDDYDAALQLRNGEVPEPGDLLTWGGLRERGALHWVIDGPADSWITVAQNFELFVFVEIERPAEEIVLALLERRLPEVGFSDPSSDRPEFAPLGSFERGP